MDETRDGYGCGGNKSYVNESDRADVLTVREKAMRHLKTWTKKNLIMHCLNASKTGWMESWAAKYDEAKK